MSQRVDTALSTLLSLSAVFLAAVVGWRQLVPERPQATQPAIVESWDELRRGSKRMGPPDASLQIVEFVDLQCPFCARFHEEVKAFQRESPEDVSLVFVHFPLSQIHPHARAAAVAMECAAEQGRMLPFMDAAFGRQDEFGTVAWTELARDDAGVRNLERFEECTEGDGLARVKRDIEFAEAMGLSATPTVIVNGWRYPAPPATSTLRDLLAQIQAGEDPFGR